MLYAFGVDTEKSQFNHLEHVQGWLKPEALFFASFYRSKFLKDKKVNTLEIGVHHGKFFIGLENITALESRAIAIDVFDEQNKNIDGSGKGDLQIFQENVARYCLNPNRVKAISQDSLDIRISDLGENNFGLLSIDGGHSANHTIADLQSANSLLDADGLVILDDILNQDWTGVVTGAVEYFASNSGRRIVPFALGFNKLFCCHFSNKHLVLRKLQESGEELSRLGILIYKTTEFAGHSVLSLKLNQA